MQRRREPARPVTPPTAATRPARRATIDAGPGRHCGAPSGRDTGHRRSRSCAVFDDGTTNPVVAAPDPRTPVYGRRFFLHSIGWASEAAVVPDATPDRPSLRPRSFARCVAST
jgi:hypothetical protein